MTTITLLATMTFFYLPHTIYYLVSINGGVSGPDHPVVVYYMTLMPYVKMISDPIVYGVRMRRRHRTTVDDRRGVGFSVVGHGANHAATTAIGASTSAAAAAVAIDELVGMRRSGTRRQTVYVCCCLPMFNRFVLSATFAAATAADGNEATAVPETTSLTTTGSSAVTSLQASGRHRWTHGVDTGRCGQGGAWSATRRMHRSTAAGGECAGAAYGLIRLETLTSTTTSVKMTRQEKEEEQFL